NSIFKHTSKAFYLYTQVSKKSRNLINIKECAREKGVYNFYQEIIEGKSSSKNTIEDRDINSTKYRNIDSTKYENVSFTEDKDIDSTEDKDVSFTKDKKVNFTKIMNIDSTKNNYNNELKVKISLLEF
ncbi:428_t:CDS:1, partial [Gigaspora rosea]